MREGFVEGNSILLWASIDLSPLPSRHRYAFAGLLRYVLIVGLAQHVEPSALRFIVCVLFVVGAID
jgi:hypothetical protein